MHAQIAANQRAGLAVAAAVVVGPVLLGVLAGLLLPSGWGWALAAALLAVAVVAVAAAPSLGERLALTAARASPADPATYPRYHNLVEGLCEAAGLPMPRLYVVDSDAANAFSVGPNPSRAAIVVTRGLLTTLNRVELEGVLAHELSHVRSSAVRLRTAAVVLGGLPGLAWERRWRGGGALYGLAAVLLSPLAPLLALAAPGRLEFEADEAGAYLTRYPPGLASALAKLQTSAGPLEAGSVGLRHLWVAPPGPNGDAPSWERFAAVPPLDQRIAALRDL